MIPNPTASLRPGEGPGRSWSHDGLALRLDCGNVFLNVRLEGHGPPLLLLHGYPQNHRMWRRCLPALSARFTVILPDLRGYGDSDKPAADATAAAYAKRTMAGDLVALLDRLGVTACPVIGHDRGARVAHRLALDHPERVTALGVVDILPTLWHHLHPDPLFAQAYWHWGFLAAGEEPLRLLSADPDGFLARRLAAWSRVPDCFDAGDLEDYQRCFRDPACLAATCADYRAAAGIDLEHDRADLGRKLPMPVWLAWGARGFVGSHYDPPAVWRGFAETIQASPMDCGHFPAEETPADFASALLGFLLGRH
jgi:haloacetate dehalogenase